ncbi:MAG: proline racemase family protein, partial [Pseudomonadota bacterium]
MRSRRAIHVIAAHAEGEVGRVITGGVLPPPGATLMEQRTWLEHNDDLRQLLIREPRGGVFTHYNLIVPAKDPRADAGFIIMEPTDYPPMSGSNSICVATVLLETGILAMDEPITHLTLETPGGLVAIEATCEGGRCKSIKTTNVPCYAHALDQTVSVEGLGDVTFDICYGGAFFALVDAA